MGSAAVCLDMANGFETEGLPRSRRFGDVKIHPQGGTKRKFSRSTIERSNTGDHGYANRDLYDGTHVGNIPAS